MIKEMKYFNGKIHRFYVKCRRFLASFQTQSGGTWLQSFGNTAQYNKNYLTAKPLERARSCFPVINLHENNTQEILQTKNCLEQSIKENTQNPTTTTTP